MTQSSVSRGKPTSLPSEDVNLVDISAIAAAHPVNVKTCRLDLNTFDASGLTLIEVLDMAEAAGVSPEALASMLSASRTSPSKVRLLFALAWVVARRADASLAYAEVCTWKLDVIGVIKENPTAVKRAAMVVNAARLTGLPPSEAGKLTVAEIGAYGAANRRTRRKRAS